MADNLLEIQNLSVNIGDKSILRDIELNIKKGEMFTEENIRSVRPSEGCSPKYLPELLGCPSDRDYKFGEPIKYENEHN